MTGAGGQGPGTRANGEKGLIEVRDFSFRYGGQLALRNVTFTIQARSVTAIIGPSGCGKSTFLRSMNRLNDLIPDAAHEGEIVLDGRSVYAPGTDLVMLRQRVGMVFQRPNPFPKTIFDNVAYGPRLNGLVSRQELPGVVERCLRQAALWDEVKDRLDMLGTKLSGGQQQRLTLARALSLRPDILCLDEFSIAIDPVTTMKIEEVLLELRSQMTIVLVTNLVQQARRLAQRTAFLNGSQLVEVGETKDIFTKPEQQMTYDYVTGNIG